MSILRYFQVYIPMNRKWAILVFDCLNKCIMHFKMYLNWVSTNMKLLISFL